MTTSTPRYPGPVEPAQSPADAPRSLPRDLGPVRLYEAAVRHVAARAAVRLSSLALRLGRWAAPTVRSRTVSPEHPTVWEPPAVVPDGYAEGRADLQLTHRPRLVVVNVTPPAPGEEEAVRETRRRYH